MNTRTVWTDSEVNRLAPMPEPERAPKGTFTNAHLTSPYFRIENSKGTTKFRVPYRSRRLMKLRLRLAAVRQRWGVVTQSGMADREQGSRVLADKTQHCRVQDLQCRGKHNVSQDFTIPADQLIVPGFTWAFRTSFYRRDLDKTPLFQCVGLEV